MKKVLNLGRFTLKIDADGANLTYVLFFVIVPDCGVAIDAMLRLDITLCRSLNLFDLAVCTLIFYIISSLVRPFSANLV